MYLKQFSAAEARKLRECFPRGKVGTLLRLESRKRIKGALLPLSYLKHSAVLGLKANQASQTHKVKKSTTGSQIGNVVVFTSQEAQDLVAKGQLPSTQREHMLGPFDEPPLPNSWWTGIP